MPIAWMLIESIHLVGPPLGLSWGAAMRLFGSVHAFPLEGLLWPLSVYCLHTAKHVFATLLAPSIIQGR